MTRKLILSVALRVLVIWLPNAGATCTRPINYGNFEGQVNGNLDWLLCLHNEQVDSLNGHANRLADLSDQLYAASELNASILDQLETINGSVMTNFMISMQNQVTFEEKLLALTARIAALEAELAER